MSPTDLTLAFKAAIFLKFDPSNMAAGGPGPILSLVFSTLPYLFTVTSECCSSELLATFKIASSMPMGRGGPSQSSMSSNPNDGNAAAAHRVLLFLLGCCSLVLLAASNNATTMSIGRGGSLLFSMSSNPAPSDEVVAPIAATAILPAMCGCWMTVWWELW